MIFDFLKKQNKIEEKKRLAKIMFSNLHISQDQKDLYIQALDILDEAWIDRIYNTLSSFVKETELKQVDDLYKQSYSKVSGLRKKEALERTEELNSFNFLLTKL